MLASSRNDRFPKDTKIGPDIELLKRARRQPSTYKDFWDFPFKIERKIPTTTAFASTSPPPSLPQPDYGFELISDTDHQPTQAQPLGGGSHPYLCIIQESVVDEDSGNINSGFGISSEDQTSGELGTENVQLSVSGFPVHDNDMLDFLNCASFDDLVDMVQLLTMT
ncbi:protein CUP-SHAPED COTYLEDON 1-like [Prunus yedoensis var. nudiflora]|uniref:Protein CUP-SHAPED COTYLEDON 1-like n=1 Tax=Prunus yedoensis var. nudiflora TaxID=2094558 RepID=A0A314XUQ7_PRUYE|nr:protein CUP-SHAPED COTYLEDON 1-like [Prunus yedoensis var. nudiflora]